MTCPICARPADPNYRPFCSRRCADIDLGRWLTGGYAVPAEDEDWSEDSTEPPPRQ
ncbi:DNA gyrase inhibitor YacG [Palleronia sediminis]|uniref:DNA gyrase inhibitor YacG n=1 Tax=Palleronia sediminis TaxID=2547833 RepID=A0A4R6A9J3_9RHOB|nr:DNA gyrase inhibitor YacG [Palleronia sediminis]TDL77723.1 DNA gyrase inhibitor YacG [Palleronia sediminis]